MNRKNHRAFADLDPKLVLLFQSGFRKGDLRKAEIIQSAIEIISKDGLEGLSFERLGKRAGIAKSHVVYHFHNKDEIFRKSIEYITSTAQSVVVDRLANSQPGIDRLRQYILGNFEWAQKYPDQTKTFILFIATCPRVPDLADFHQKVRIASMDRIEAILSEMNFRPSQRRTRLSRNVLDLITGGIIEVMSVPSKNLSRQLTDRAEEICLSVEELLKQ